MSCRCATFCIPSPSTNCKHVSCRRVSIVIGETVFSILGTSVEIGAAAGVLYFLYSVWRDFARIFSSERRGNR